MSATVAGPAPGFAEHPEHRVVLEPCPRRVRVVFAGRTVADSTRVQYLFESGLPPVYYFPRRDVRTDLLAASERRSYCPFKGEASYYSIRVDERLAQDAVWAYEQPYAEVAPLAELVAFYWNRVDHWYEEDEEVFVHPRDPYVRVDALPSSRRVEVVVDGVTVAASERGVFLFETGLPTRYYLPKEDVRMDLLTPSRKRTRCPYKGEACYWSVRAGAGVRDNAAWCYEEPLAECGRIRGMLAFDPDKVDELRVEGAPPAA